MSEGGPKEQIIDKPDKIETRGPPGSLTAVNRCHLPVDYHQPAPGIGTNVVYAEITMEKNLETVDRMAEETGIDEYQILTTKREFKKDRVKYRV